MLRACVTAFLVLLVGCGGGAPPKPRPFPPSVAGLKLRAEEPVAADQLAKYVAASNIKRATQLEYHGLNNIRIVVIDTDSAAVAFEAVQKWRAEDGKRVVNAGHFLLVAESEKGNLPAVDAFLTAFEKQLP